LEERECSCKVFPQRLVNVRGVSFSRPQRCHAHVSTFVCVRCVSRRCSRASSPRAWAHLRRSGRALRLVYAPLRRPFVGRRGEVSTIPIERVANRGSLIELLAGGSSGRPCPVRYRSAVVRRHVHRSTLRGCARQSSVPFDGDRGCGSSPSMGSLE
jgi:hypothetical protein